MLNLGREPTVTTTWPSLGPPPRNARIRRSTWLIGTGVPVVFLTFAISSWRSEQRALAALQEIVDTGIETNGRVFQRRTNRSNRRTRYLVTARYLVGGRWLTREFESKAVFDRAPRQPDVVVTYAAANPLRARLGTRDAVARLRERGLAIRWWVAGFLCAFATVFSWLYWRRMRLLLSLARTGIVRWGTVTAIRPAKYSSVVTVHVDDGYGSAVQKGTAGLDFARFQPVGSQAAVLGDPNDPTRIRLAEEVSNRVEILTVL